MHLSTKMLLYNLLGKGIVLLFFLMAGPLFLNHFAIKNIDAELIDKRDQILEIISKEGMSGFFTEEDTLSGFGSYNILREEYILLEKFENPYPLDSIFNEKRVLDQITVSYRVCAYIFGFDENYYLLEIGKSLETIENLNLIIYRVMVFLLVLFIVFSILLDNIFSKYILRPFSLIIKEKISRIREPQEFLHKPVKTTTIDFKVLDEAISDMMWRIQKSFNQEREFISHASHELKTPVSILQTKIEALFAQSELSENEMEKLMDMQGTIQKMKKTINSLLLLSKVNNAQFIKTVSFQLGVLLRELAEEWEMIAEDRNIKLKLNLKDDYMLENSNKSLCQIMFQNIISNAIKNSPDGTVIELAGEKSETGYKVLVSDKGSGIPEGLMSQVRSGLVFLSDANKESSGYGLQIVFKIATFLGVEINLKSGESGTQFTFTFNYYKASFSNVDQK